ncbi:MAG TPA: VWA domain-containing protein [Hyphomicrobium sp.]|nr:VWA domain-containing protein [Hyphomicrobium sp.]
MAILFAAMILALCLFAGAAVDLGRWMQARAQTIAAADAAVLAGARILQIDDKNVEGAREAAKRYYIENTKSRTPVVDDTITFSEVDNKTAFAATGNAYIETTFLNLAHISKLPLLVPSKAVLRAGGQSDNAVEISMMLDVTGSMGMPNTKIRDLKKAAADLVDIVISSDINYNPVRIAVVPFAEGVRLPSSANEGARGKPDKFSRNGDTYHPTECVVERKGNNKFTDAAPGENNFVMTLFIAEQEDPWTGKKRKVPCGMGPADELMPLTNDKTALKNRINGLQLSGSTAGQIGTAWAWYTLSPNWNSLWPEPSAAGAYNNEDIRKIAILMTDGDYNLQYDGKGVQSSNGVNGDSTSQARSLCTNMKAKGITVYTVGFAVGNLQRAIDTLTQCASDPSMFYQADNGIELQQAFRDIALKINQLYLTQ